MKNNVLFVLLDKYAEWEAAPLAAALNSGVTPLGDTRFTTATVAPTADAVSSIGGFSTLPDYDFDSMPQDYAALVLVGGMSWDKPEAGRVEELVARALREGKTVGAICNGASFMAAHGFLNDVTHTGNGLDQLRLWGGERYTNPEGFIERQAVADGSIVTANGSAGIEFAREMLLALEADTRENIDAWYDFNKHGFYRR